MSDREPDEKSAEAARQEFERAWTEMEDRWGPDEHR